MSRMPPALKADGTTALHVATLMARRLKGSNHALIEVKKQLELFTQGRQEPDPAKTLDLGKQILQIAADQFYYIGLSSVPNTYGIAKNDFHNVPEKMIEAVAPGIVHPEQFAIGQ